MSRHGHPLGGLTYTATICATSADAAAMLHHTARHSVGEDGALRTVILGGPDGVPGDQPRSGVAELLAEQGEALIFRTRQDGDEAWTTVVLTLHSAAAGEVFATDGSWWVRAIAAIEGLPAIAHEH